MGKKTILSLTMECGSGHKSQAMAVHDAIMKRYPEQFEIITLDTFKDMGSLRLDALYKKSWQKALKMPPKVLKALYVPWKSRVLTHGFERAVGQGCIRRLKQQIEAIRPDLIISTHFTPTHYLSVLKRRGELDIPVAVIHSEPYDTFASWKHHWVDNYICFSDMVQHELRRTCQCKDVSVFNFPLNARFSKTPGEQRELREKLGLAVDDLTLLATCGGEGIGLQEDYLEQLYRSGLPWQVVVICGRNEALKQRLDAYRMPAGSRCKLKAFGFMRNMEEFIGASDVVLGKAGPATTFECLVLGRPVIQTHYMPQEEGVMRYVTQNKLGWYAPNADCFLQIMRDIVEHPESLRERQEAIMKAGFRDGSDDIADYIVNLIKSGDVHRSA
jgi:UDP-N-acetylglucosamine:LPS N-acetylglucosamine transferase